MIKKKTRKIVEKDEIYVKRELVWTVGPTALVELFKTLMDMGAIIYVGENPSQEKAMERIAKDFNVKGAENPSSLYSNGKDKLDIHRMTYKLWQFDKNHIKELNEKDGLHHREKAHKAKCNKPEFDIDDNNKERVVEELVSYYEVDEKDGTCRKSNDKFQEVKPKPRKKRKSRKTNKKQPTKQ